MRFQQVMFLRLLEPHAAQTINAMCYWFKMRRIDAAADATLMVRLKFFWNWPDESFIRNTMGKSEFLFPVFAANGDVSITVAVLTAHPYPASGFRDDLDISKKFLFQLFRRYPLVGEFAIVRAVQILAIFQAAWICLEYDTAP